MTNANSIFPNTRLSLLLQLQSSGEEAAWNEFVSLYRPVIYRMARRSGLQDADAQDLTQKVLMSVAGAIESWEKRDESIRFRHWLRLVVRNDIIKALTRKPRDRAAGGTPNQALLDAQPYCDKDVSRDINLEYRREIFFRSAQIVRAEVAADTWQAFQLAVVENIPIEEVAERIGKSVGAAYAARGRVMSRLQRTVESLEESES